MTSHALPPTFPRARREGAARLCERGPITAEVEALVSGRALTAVGEQRLDRFIAAELISELAASADRAHRRTPRECTRG